MRCRVCQAHNDDSAVLCFECRSPLAATVAVPSPPATTSSAARPGRPRGVLWLVPALLGGVSMALSLWQYDRKQMAARQSMEAAPPSPSTDARQAAATLEGGPAGTLRLSTVPPAEITIDGVPVKGSLRRIPLSPGTHVVRLETPRYQPIQRAIRIRSGEVTSLEIDFAEDGVGRNE